MTEADLGIPRTYGPSAARMGCAASIKPGETVSEDRSALVPPPGPAPLAPDQPPLWYLESGPDSPPEPPSWQQANRYAIASVLAGTSASVDIFLPGPLQSFRILMGVSVSTVMLVLAAASFVGAASRGEPRLGQAAAGLAASVLALAVPITLLLV